MICKRIKHERWSSVFPNLHVRICGLLPSNWLYGGDRLRTAPRLPEPCRTVFRQHATVWLPGQRQLYFAVTCTLGGLVIWLFSVLCGLCTSQARIIQDWYDINSSFANTMFYAEIVVAVRTLYFQNNTKKCWVKNSAEVFVFVARWAFPNSMHFPNLMTSYLQMQAEKSKLLGVQSSKLSPMDLTFFL